MVRRAEFCLFLVLLATFAFGQTRGSSAASRIPGFGPPNANERDSLPSTTDIDGTVVTIDNRPVAQANVELRNVTDGNVFASVYSSTGGRFEIQRIPRGQYELVVHSGLSESRQRITVDGARSSLVVRMSGSAAPQAADGATVSVAQMNVPDKARKAYHKADEAFSKQKVEEASEQVEKALAIFPDYAEALTLRGILRLRQNQVGDAVADLEKAINCDPNDGMAHVVLGSAYNMLKRSDDAQRVLDRAVSLAPKSWQAYFERSRALIAKQQYPDALRDIEKAQAFSDRDFPVIHLVKANALIGLKDYADAKAEIQAYLDREPNGTNATEARRALEQIQDLTSTAQNVTVRK